MMLIKAHIYALFVLLVGYGYGLSFSVETGGGDLTNLNSVLNLLTLGLNLNIEPKEISYSAGFITVPLEAVIGKKGVCTDLLINEGGDIYVTGKFLNGTSEIEGFDTPLQAYEIDISIEVLQFACEIPLMVTVDLASDIVNTVDGFGNLTFRSETASISQKIIAYSPDFQVLPSVYAIAGECDAQPDVLTYSGDNLGEILGVDITDIVIGELESDPSYVFNDVRIELCKLGNDLGGLIASLLVIEDLTNISSSFYVSNPFLPDENGDIEALESEIELYTEYEDEVDGLLNLLNDDNFVVQLLIAESNNETAILNTILELLVDPDDENDFDPVILLVADLLDIPVEEDGSLQNIDILSLLSDDLISFTINTTLIDAIIIRGTIDLNVVLLDVFPPQPENEEEEAPFILPPFLGFSNQTVLLDGIQLDAIGANAKIGIKLEVENIGVPDDDFLSEPFLLEFEELLELSLSWDGFLASLGILFALNVDYLIATEVGPLVDNLIDCILALFPLAPTITGATLDHDLISIDIGQLDDSIFILIADIIEVILPVFQPVIPRAIELLLADAVTNVQFFDETECPREDPNTDNIDLFPFNFSEGLLQGAQDFLNAENINNLLSNFEITDNGLYFIGNARGYDADAGAGFEVEVPTIDGWTQNVSIYLQGLAIEGILPPFFRELSLFNVVEDSIYNPQYLNNILNIGKTGDQVGAKLLFNITCTEPQIDPEVDPALVSPEPPDVFQVQYSYINATWYTDAADLILDLYLKYSQYDIRGTTIGDFINVGCWGSKLDYPGGIEIFSIFIETMNAEIVCDPCENDVVQTWYAHLANPESYELQLWFLNDILNRFGMLMVNLFDEDRFPLTKEVSTLVCEENDYGIIGTMNNYSVADYHTDVSTLLPFLAFFCVSIQLPYIVAMCLNNYGPQLNKIKKQPINSKVNQDLIKSARVSGDEDLIEKARTLELGMYENPLISRRAKILLPVMIFINFILFIIGDTGDAVRIDIVGQFFDVPYNDFNFRTLSVLSSVVELFRTGGWLLGLLLFTLSILWPYVKLAVMAYCWRRSPTKLSVASRGKIIEFVDFFGRFSFAEFHFLVFVLVVFQLEGTSPRGALFPDRDMFFLGLEVEPLLSLFTFCLAVVMSIVLSNIMLVYQHGIEDETRIRTRETNLLDRSDKESEEILALDKKKIRVTNWSFRVDEEDEAEEKHYFYQYKISRRAVILLALIVLTASGCLLLASFANSLEVKLYGFFAYLVQFAGGERVYEVSVYGLLYEAIKKYSSSYIVYFVGFIFIVTIVVIPVIQTILLLTLLFKSFTLKTARQITEAHHVMTVWCCIDVFIIAISLTVLELPTVASGLASNLDFCDDLGEIMFTFLEPMGYFTNDDVDAGCIVMKSGVTFGAYIAVLSVFVLNIANFFVSRLFYSFIADREKVSVENQKSIKFQTSELKRFHQFLNNLGLIIISKPEVFNTATNSQANPMFEGPESKQSYFSNVSTKSKSKRVGSKQMGSAVSSFEIQKNPMFSDYPAEDKLVELLTDFYEKHDTGKKRKAEQQIKKALKEPNGLEKLNTKLQRDYNDGVQFKVEF